MDKTKKYKSVSTALKIPLDSKSKSSNAVQEFQPSFGRGGRGRRAYGAASLCVPPANAGTQRAGGGRNSTFDSFRRARERNNNNSNNVPMAECGGREQVEYQGASIGNSTTNLAASGSLEHTAGDNCGVVDKCGDFGAVGGTHIADSSSAKRRSRRVRRHDSNPPISANHNHNHQHSAMDVSHWLGFHIETARDAHVERYSGAQWRRLRTRRGFERATTTTSNSSRFSRPRHVQEQYLQARCQFVVCEDAGLSVNYSDPDALVDWSYVQQVRLFDDASSVCAICLYAPPPSLGRLTRCGHVFCWPCVLHYLALSDRASRPCPICEQPLSVGELLSCQLLERRPAVVGQQLSMRLMMRHRYSLQPRPVPELDNDDALAAYCGEDNWHSPYVTLTDSCERQKLARIVLATPDQVECDIIDAEQRALEQQLHELRHEPHVCFVEQALQLLAERRRQLALWRQQLSQRAQPPFTINNEPASAAEAVAADQAVVEYASAFDDQQCGGGCGGGGDERATVDGADQHQVYFYQAEDGRPVYLHALNARMLLEQHGGEWLRCPRRLADLTVLELEPVSVDEPLRRRHSPLLAHVAVGTQVQLVLLDLQPPLVSAPVFALFKDQLKRRDARRRGRERRERQMTQHNCQSHHVDHITSPSQHYFTSSPPQPQPSPPLPVITSQDETEVNQESHDDGDVEDVVEMPSFAELLRGGQRVSAGGGRVREQRRERGRQETEASVDDPLQEGWSADLAAMLDLIDKQQGDAVPGEARGCAKKPGKKRNRRLVLSSGMPF